MMRDLSMLAWAARWGVPPQAMQELGVHMGIPAQPTSAVGMGEAEVSQRVRLAADADGVWLTRNNVGALQDKSGRLVRYGLANETDAQNKRLKSGDDIGIRPVLITSAHVGQVIGQFVSVEMKAAGWRYSGTGREPAQLAWIKHVERHGGRALFVTSVDDWRAADIVGWRA